SFTTSYEEAVENAKVIWAATAASPVNGLIKFNDGTGPALAANVNISMNYTGVNFKGLPGVTTTSDSPFPGANYNLNNPYPAYVFTDFQKLVFNATTNTGADKSVFVWTNYNFATNAPGL
ncbi:MAG: hypothetical protein ABI554_05330, partial [Flavobacterium sp.]